MADAFATALAVGGAEAFDVFDSLDGYEAYWIRADGFEQATGGITFARSAAAPPASRRATVAEAIALGRHHGSPRDLAREAT
jgi:hypothetical protein